MVDYKLTYNCDQKYGKYTDMQGNMKSMGSKYDSLNLIHLLRAHRKE